MSEREDQERGEEEACAALNAELTRHQTFVNSGAHGWHEAQCRCGWSVEYGRRTEVQAHDLVRDHLNQVSAEAIWPFAEDAGYRRAVQALRDAAKGKLADATFNPTLWAVFEAAADHLEHLAAAPRNEGAQT